MIKNIIPLTRKVVGVYANDNGSIWRGQCDYLALSERGEVTVGDINSDGYCEDDVSQSDNFIGLEFSDKELNWDKEVKIWLEEKKKK